MAIATLFRAWVTLVTDITAFELLLWGVEEGICTRMEFLAVRAMPQVAGLILCAENMGLALSYTTLKSECTHRYQHY
jgi:hypothetical protein